MLSAIDAQSRPSSLSFQLALSSQQLSSQGIGQALVEETLGWITAGLCTPHSLDLAIEDMAKLEWVAKRVVSAKDIVKFIRGHQKSLALYRSKANLELVLAGETRFATNFLSPWRAPR